MRIHRISATLAVALAIALVSGAATAQVWPTVKQHDSGPSDNRLDIVILGDGYTAAQMPLFRTHVTNFINAFLSTTPMSRYRNHVNIWRVEVESNESGADKPSACFGSPVFRDTALDSTYCTANIRRCLTASSGLALTTAMVNVPEYDEVLVVVNDGEYGGCAGVIATYTGVHGSSLEVGIHEAGHSVFALADEYGGGGAYGGGQPSRPNLSVHDETQMMAQQSKWYYWLGIEGVTAVEGGGGYDTGVYRPKSNCKMRNLGAAFCPICREQHVETMWSHVTSYESVNPPTGGGEVYTSSTVLSVQLPALGSGSYSPEWYVDGAFASGGTQTVNGSLTTLSFDPSSFLGGPTSGAAVTLHMVDGTTFYRKTASYEPLPAVSWGLNDDDVDFSVSALTVLAAPNQSGDIFELRATVTNHGGSPSAPCRLAYVASANSDISTADIFVGTHDVPSLAPGASDTADVICRVPVDMPFSSVYLGAIADDLAQVFETDETNNTAVTPGQLPVSLISPLDASTVVMDFGVPDHAFFTFDAGPTHAGEACFFFASLTQPPPGGTPLGPFAGSVDFAFDDLSVAILNGVIGSPFFNGFLGTLDSSGRANADWFKPAVPDLGLLSVHFVVLTAGTHPGTGQPTIPQISNRRVIVVL